MISESIIIRGAKEHNLKKVDIRLPRNKLIVFTGVSGSGKSSLAFDTLYAEGQRRYVESLSSFARQFIGQMEKPKLTTLAGSAQRSPSNKSLSAAIHAQQWQRLLRWRIICACCLPGLGRPIAICVDESCMPNQPRKLSLR